MPAFFSRSWNAIKANSESEVKTSCLLATLLLAFVNAGSGHCATEIEAKTFSVKTNRLSQSKHVYLFDAPNAEKPTVGRIILIKKNWEPVMAFRVIKDYPGKNQFAAKMLKHYGAHHEIEPGENFDAIEKVADVAAGGGVATSAPLETGDIQDLIELEGNPSAPKPQAAEPVRKIAATDELPPPPSPAPLKAALHASNDTDLDSLDRAVSVAPTPAASEPATIPPPNIDPVATAQVKTPPKPDIIPELGSTHLPPDEAPPINRTPAEGEMAIEEVQIIDIYRSWLTGGFGILRNRGPADGFVYFGGGGVRYGYSIMRGMLLQTPDFQDSLAVEAGVFLYKVLNFQSDNNAYSVMPLIGTLRYNIFLNESFGFFLYGGLNQNLVLATAGEATDEGKQILASLLPAAGLGFIFRIGPNWDTRIDFGLDAIGAGLMLRF